jgi:seryl-tRNA synthetase
MILRKLNIFRTFKTARSINSIAYNQNHVPTNRHKFILSNPVLNERYLLDKSNLENIDENIRLRKGVGNIHVVHEINDKLQNDTLDPVAKEQLMLQLQEEMKKIPNDTHPEVKNLDDPKVVKFFNKTPEFSHKPLEFSDICKKLNILRTDYLGNFAGHRSYYLMKDLAELVSIFFYFKKHHRSKLF